MDLKPLRKYQGVKYPTLRMYYAGRFRRSVMRTAALAAGIAGLTALMGCIRGYS